MTTPSTIDQGRLAQPRRLQVGNLELLALTDGVFRPQPGYFSPEAGDADHRGLFDPRHGPMSSLPIGCFLVFGIPGRLVLIDAGLGPASITCTSTKPGDASDFGTLLGGTLIDQLTASNVDPAAVTDVVVTHLHADHCGWLAHTGSQPFANAMIWV